MLENGQHLFAFDLLEKCSPEAKRQMIKATTRAETHSLYAQVTANPQSAG